ncbi:Hypothetical predicted protein [Lecanosticta acicola]|uniref:Uncharacterized protein n=1 Tax=Lecanosticta acicola TaxID=111012 RepID=A0AAI9EFK0_9PEZI|nr:Hypothetical predicted protein [Lecanosticta acicola]
MRLAIALSLSLSIIGLAWEHPGYWPPGIDGNDPDFDHEDNEAPRNYPLREYPVPGNTFFYYCRSFRATTATFQIDEVNFLPQHPFNGEPFAIQFKAHCWEMSHRCNVTDNAKLELTFARDHFYIGYDGHVENYKICDSIECPARQIDLVQAIEQSRHRETGRYWIKARIMFGRQVATCFGGYVEFL